MAVFAGPVYDQVDAGNRHMHMLLQKTGPYLHAPDDLLRLRFESGGTPRLFTLLFAQARASDGDVAAAGMAVLDEDEGRVLLDRHAADAPDRGASELYRVHGLDWAEFSAFCRTHPRYRGGAPDIDNRHDTPLPGSRTRQARLGAAADLVAEPPPGAGRDLRSELMRRADADPSCPVRFPPRDRAGVLADLGGRAMRSADRGSWHLGWPVRFPSAADLTGIAGDTVVDRSLDLAWSDLIEQRPELIEEARMRSIERVASAGLGTFGAEDAGRYDLRLLETGQGAAILLLAVDDLGIGAISAEALTGELARMPDNLLRDLWKLSRTVEHELSPDQLGLRFGAALNLIRSETEAMRDAEPAPHGP